MSKKSSRKKAMLGKKLKQNRRIPLFVVARTNRRVISNNRRRAWRNQKMKIKEK
ncbi:MAG: 50S ribosomal protein L39e [Candidatus Micrarchaeota archaeon]